MAESSPGCSVAGGALGNHRRVPGHGGHQGSSWEQHWRAGPDWGRSNRMRKASAARAPKDILFPDLQAI